jgi:hypothetical protein
MNVRIWTLASDNGDGSSSSLIFSSKEEAQAYAMAQFKAIGEGSLDENISYEDLEFDESGKLLNGQKPYEVW